MSPTISQVTYSGDLFSAKYLLPAGHSLPNILPPSFPKVLKDKGAIPPSTKCFVPELYQVRADWVATDWFAIHEYPFRLGLRLPFSDFVKEVFEVTGLAPGQVCPSFWQIILGVDLLRQKHNLDITAKDLAYQYHVCFQPAPCATLRSHRADMNLVLGIGDAVSPIWCDKFFIHKESFGGWADFLPDIFSSMPLQLDGLAYASAGAAPEDTLVRLVKVVSLPAAEHTLSSMFPSNVVCAFAGSPYPVSAAVAGASSSSAPVTRTQAGPSKPAQYVSKIDLFSEIVNQMDLDCGFTSRAQVKGKDAVDSPPLLFDHESPSSKRRRLELSARSAPVTPLELGTSYLQEYDHLPPLFEDRGFPTNGRLGMGLLQQSLEYICSHMVEADAQNGHLSGKAAHFKDAYQRTLADLESLQGKYAALELEMKNLKEATSKKVASVIAAGKVARKHGFQAGIIRCLQTQNDPSHPPLVLAQEWYKLKATEEEAQRRGNLLLFPGQPGMGRVVGSEVAVGSTSAAPLVASSGAPSSSTSCPVVISAGASRSSAIPTSGDASTSVSIPSSAIVPYSFPAYAAAALSAPVRRRTRTPGRSPSRTLSSPVRSMVPYLPTIVEDAEAQIPSSSAPGVEKKQGEGGKSDCT